MKKNQIKILLTGGAGYIGLHTALSLIESNMQPIILDNFINSNVNGIKRIEKLTNQEIKYYEGDVRDSRLLENIFLDNHISGVIHLAGLKAVEESCKNPILYFDSNVNGSISLFKIMQQKNVKNLVFSSSATVYGNPSSLPLKENYTLNPTNPYGNTKLIVENICRDLIRYDSSININNPWKICLLRYFNPIGAHDSGYIGEDPKGIPNNIMPYILQVALGKLECLSIYGDDYNTKDGTGVRDYIHVMDIAKGHVNAIKKMLDMSNNNGECIAVNLGTNKGTSVLDLIKIFEEVTNIKINYQIKPRRSGDIASCYADASLAKEKLNWKAKKSINEMIADSWKWQKNNPDGYN